MAPGTVNVLLTSFPGLDLPSTLCIPTSSDTPISELCSLVCDRLPSSLTSPLLLTTRSGKILCAESSHSISSLQSGADNNQALLPLRLSAPLCGGKGGFGSQLRAAGGRMSSRKKKARGEEGGSNRNLDGRRLRTVTEAKALAEYLAVKPEMDKKEKEERRKRWEQVVEAADRREHEIKSGKGKAKVDGAWLEEKEESESKVREAVVAAMQNGLLRDRTGAVDQTVDESLQAQESSSDSTDEGRDNSSSKDTTPPSESDVRKNPPRKLYGWDDDDDDDDDEEEEDDDNDNDDEDHEMARVS